MASKKILVVCPGCGKERIVAPENIKRSGHSYCNGCASIKRYGKDYIGKTFGRLTIVSDAEPVYDKRGGRRAMVNCLCSCGKTSVAERKGIMCGDTRSCGCLREEAAIARIEKFNLEHRNSLTEEEREAARLSRSSKESKRWLREVKSAERCVICGSSQNLAAHHLESYKENPELRFETSNGVCLCARCHIEYHTQFLGGYHVPATIATFDKFMRMKNGELDDK